MGRVWVGVALLVLVRSTSAFSQTVLDDFEDISGWRVSSSEGARGEIARDAGHGGMGLRLDFDMGGGGYVILHKDLRLALPENYTFKFWERGTALPNNFELKLIGRNGDNVWWYKQHSFRFTADWREIIVKKPRIEFAWGPLGGGPPKDITAIEIALSAGQGGKGSVWLDDLRVEKREADTRADLKPKATASTEQPGHEAQMVLDQKADTSWRSGTIVAEQWLTIDLQTSREYGALIVDWEQDDFAVTYDVETSLDGKEWKPLHACVRGNGGRDYIYSPDAESRFMRFNLKESSRGQGYGIIAIYIAPYELSISPNRFFEMIARDAAPGMYPKYLSGKQTYWTVVGVDGAGKEALINEEGTIEPHREGFSIEPFLYADGKLSTWSSMPATQELEEGYLPIPSVVRPGDGISLKVTAVAAGAAASAALHVRYRVENHSDAAKDAKLFVAVRPFQVLPPWQNLNLVGGATQIEHLGFEDGVVSVNGRQALQTLTAPEQFGSSTFDEGMVTDFIAGGRVPPQTHSSDPFGYASGALMYSLRLEPRASADVYVAVPFHQFKRWEIPPAESAGGPFAAAMTEASEHWRRRLNHVELQLPASAQRIVRSIKSTLAYTLINRNGAALFPGPRTYARAWIRDGAMISSALLEMGLPDEVRDFVRWYAPYQAEDGRIPCCVDERGADRVPEHDSDGEFIFAIAEYYRHTRDIGFLHEMWPAVIKAVQHLESLRAKRTTEEYRRPDKLRYFGLLTESISHEGYSSHPVHSYWDNFFALRGFKDAAALAVAVGDDDRAVRFAALRDAFRQDVFASIARTMEEKHIDFIPGSADLGDYDPSSTAIAITLGSEYAHFPQAVLRNTFEKYWTHVQTRQVRQVADEAYSAYELRNVGALIRLGQRERAYELLTMLLDDQRPAAWNQWQEITWKDRSLPRFIGDMPHTWVASSLIQSVRSAFAIEDDAARSLILGAGLPEAWLAGGEAVSVKRLPTHFGVLHFSLQREEPKRLRARIGGDIALPRGQIILRPPLPAPLKGVTINGRATTRFDADSATIDEFPADVVLEY